MKCSDMIAAVNEVYEHCAKVIDGTERVSGKVAKGNTYYGIWPYRSANARNKDIA